MHACNPGAPVPTQKALLHGEEAHGQLAWYIQEALSQTGRRQGSTPEVVL